MEPQLARQWKILRLLESRKRGLTVAELSSELDVPPRTAYRDLEAIQEAGFPVYTEREGRSSYWRLVDGFTSSLPLPFTVTELMALHMSRDIFRVFDGTVFQESIESLFDKVETALPRRDLSRLGGKNIATAMGQCDKLIPPNETDTGSAGKQRAQG